MKMFTVYDEAAEKYSPPFLAPTNAVAQRMYSSSMKDVPYPSDYHLYLIGEFDQETGLVTVLDENVEFTPEVLHESQK